ncbi:hypothetical protein, partial [Nostoc sp.]
PKAGKMPTPQEVEYFFYLSAHKQQKPGHEDRAFEEKQWGYIPRSLVIEVQYNIDALICTTTPLRSIPENSQIIFE